MRAAVLAVLLLAVLLLAGCTAGPGATTSPSAPAVTAAPATPSPVPPTPSPTPPPLETPVAATEYTADDEEIANLIRAGAEEAIPQLKALNESDPSKLEDLFLPLGEWIAGQKAGVEAFTPTTCTSAAVALFMDGLDQYDDIREKFLAWRDWGATGNAFPLGAPGQAATAFREAVAELDAHCPA
jgi:hypothetical protein